MMTFVWLTPAVTFTLPSASTATVVSAPPIEPVSYQLTDEVAGWAVSAFE